MGTTSRTLVFIALLLGVWCDYLLLALTTLASSLQWTVPQNCEPKQTPSLTLLLSEKFVLAIGKEIKIVFNTESILAVFNLSNLGGEE